MLPLMAWTCADRADEPIPKIRTTRSERFLARTVMLALLKEVPALRIVGVAKSRKVTKGIRQRNV
jgi:hypothetical protein